MGAVQRWCFRPAVGRRHPAPCWLETPCARSCSGTRIAVRVALIGPVPPELGGATPGGVATHQVHLAAGLAAAGIDAPLLATNTRAQAGATRASTAAAPFPLYRMGRPRCARGQYLLNVGPQRAA